MLPAGIYIKIVNPVNDYDEKYRNRVFKTIKSTGVSNFIFNNNIYAEIKINGRDRLFIKKEFIILKDLCLVEKIIYGVEWSSSLVTLYCV